jgi:Tfp pilus assembly protein PilV
VTVGLVSLAGLLAVTLRMQLLGRNQTEAVRIAQDKLDELMSLNFDTEARIAIGGSLDSNEASHFETTVVEAGDTTTTMTYTTRWVVEAGPTDNHTGANIRVITIRVIPDTLDRRTTATYDLVSMIRRW